MRPVQGECGLADSGRSGDQGDGAVRTAAGGVAEGREFGFPAVESARRTGQQVDGGQRVGFGPTLLRHPDHVFQPWGC